MLSAYKEDILFYGTIAVAAMTGAVVGSFILRPIQAKINNKTSK